LQVKLCDPRLNALSVVATIKALYKYTSFLFPYITVAEIAHCVSAEDMRGAVVGWWPAVCGGEVCLL